MGAILKRIGDQAPRQIVLRDIPVAHCIPRVLAAIDDRERVQFAAARSRIYPTVRW